MTQAAQAGHRALFVGEQAATDALRSALADQGFRVEESATAESAFELAPGFDVVVLDLGMRTADPIETCRRLRSVTNAYIVAMGEQQSELDLVLSLSVGADDFIPKPVRTIELVARVRAMLRRPRELASARGVIAVADLEIDTSAREVTIDGKPV